MTRVLLVIDPCIARFHDNVWAMSDAIVLVVIGDKATDLQLVTVSVGTGTVVCDSDQGFHSSSSSSR